MPHLIVVALVMLVVAFIAGFLKSHWGRDSEVLFFPDEKLPCKTFYCELGGYRYECRTSNCQYAHDRDNERTSLIKMFLTLNKARRSIDVCVYGLSQYNLVEFLIKAKHRGICVRIITDAHLERQQRDGDNADDRDRFSRSDQIPRLLGANIQVKANTADGREALMHHKFVVIDRKYLLTGSFNWSHSAVTRNDESLIKTNEAKIVSMFSKKFDDMWKKLPDLQVTAPQRAASLASRRRVNKSGKI